MKSVENKAIRRNNEIHIVETITKIFTNRKAKYGARRIKMQLDQVCLDNNWDIVNIKRIRRIMKENNLICKVRTKNPYKGMAHANKEHRIYPNILNREFSTGKPREKLLTDITYLHFKKNQIAYLSAIKDCITGEIVSYVVRDDMKLNLSLDVINKLKQSDITDRTLLHSDQGVHYTSPKFSQLLRSKNIQQSMSARGRCTDNGPMESFFGHLKDEVDYENCTSLSEVQKVIDEYMIYYNQQRKQWNRKRMTPEDFRSHLLSI